MATLQVDKMAGCLPTDIRELGDMNRIPAEEGGDLYLVNGNMTKLADAGAFAKTEGGQ